MKLLLDENISCRTALFLSDLGHDALHVRDAGLNGASDDAVIGYARKHGYVLITVDRDFGNILDYTPGTHPGIIRLKIRYMPAGTVNTLLRDLFEKVAFEEISGNLVIVEEGRYRIRKKVENE